MRIGVDIDDVLYPWIDTAHALCERAGITNGRQVTQWKFYRDYGCDESEVWAVLGEATLNGELYAEDPFPNVTGELYRLHQLGHEVHLVTARGCTTQHAPVIRDLTIEWLVSHNIPHDSLTFTIDKAQVPTDWFIDDSLRNYDALVDVSRPILMTRPHNQVPGCTRRRVDSLAEFVDLVIREGGVES